MVNAWSGYVILLNDFNAIFTSSTSSSTNGTCKKPFVYIL